MKKTDQNDSTGVLNSIQIELLDLEEFSETSEIPKLHRILDYLLLIMTRIRHCEEENYIHMEYTEMDLNSFTGAVMTYFKYRKKNPKDLNENSS